MPKFLEGNKLNHEIGEILEKATNHILLICPYIKIHDRYISILKSKINNPKLHITVVFGKNESNLLKSIKKEDLDFFRQFPNIEIRYEKRLHAKYYANEFSAIITSMNLYSYSQDNNIESGVLTKVNPIGKLAKAIGDNYFDIQAKNYFERVIAQSKLLFSKVPIFNKGALGTGLHKKYLDSKIETDLLSDFFESKKKPVVRNEIPEKSQKQKEIHIKQESNRNGYCIRTGEVIPFNVEKPMSYVAYKSWAKYSDADYPENYCHFSGEKSDGKTSVNKPILRKNWKKAKAIFEAIYH